MTIDELEHRRIDPLVAAKVATELVDRYRAVSGERRVVDCGVNARQKPSSAHQPDVVSG